MRIDYGPGSRVLPAANERRSSSCWWAAGRRRRRGTSSAREGAGEAGVGAEDAADVPTRRRRAQARRSCRASRSRRPLRISRWRSRPSDPWISRPPGGASAGDSSGSPGRSTGGRSSGGRKRRGPPRRLVRRPGFQAGRLRQWSARRTAGAPIVILRASAEYLRGRTSRPRAPSRREPSLWPPRTWANGSARPGTYAAPWQRHLERSPGRSAWEPSRGQDARK
jgi:hypothetical protein